MKRTWSTLLVLLVLGGCSDDGSGDEANESIGATQSDESTGDAADDTTSGDATDTTSESSSEATSDTTSDTTETGAVALSFAADVYPIFMTRCGCHVGNAPGQLAMPDADTAYANLVDVPSVQVGQDRVVPGDPASSYLHAKVSGTQAFGDPMPPVGQLSAANKVTIEDWIAGGALP